MRISGGASTIVQALEAGAVNELTLHVAPLLLGQGRRLFDGLNPGSCRFTPTGATHSALVSHLDFRLER